MQADRGNQAKTVNAPNIAPGIEPDIASNLAKPSVGEDLTTPVVFRISPLIRFTLLSLYVALTLPLPLLAAWTEASVSPIVLSIGVVVGAIALYAALTERVIVTETQIEVTHPAWAKWLWRRGWSLAWEDITSLKPRSTGQGGIVYYFLNQAADRAFLLPVRIVGFARLVAIVEAKTGIDTRDVKPLAQPWMYLILLTCTMGLFAIDAWVMVTGLSGAFPV